MEKRVILAFVLSLGVLYAFRWMFTPPTPPPEEAATVQSAEPRPTPAPAAAPVTSTKPPKESAAPAEASPRADVRAEKAEEFAFDTSLYTAMLSNIGGTLKSYKLKAYADAEGKPIELIDGNAGNKLGWPLVLVTGDAALDDVLAKANYAARREGDALSLEFAENGVVARKHFQFSR